MTNNTIPAVSEQEDIDPVETQEWIDALEAVLEHEGKDRAQYLIEKLVAKARQSGSQIPFSANTAYINTISLDQQIKFPGDITIERRIRSYIRWNAMMMVLRANKYSNVGGHIASFASAATLYDIGHNHFWRGASETNDGDLVYIQGHSAPGDYARAYLLGRLNEEQLDRFRQEVDGNGLSSYPHPWLMPEFWQFPTVSMGLGPIMSIYQARFMRYLQDRGFAQTEGRKVWSFLGDGETDEPESLGAIGMAGREKLDNLIFVVNCNLQRLDGPVRGNGKIIQELESTFRGAGWNVIKVIWGRYWDSLFARDKDGLLVKRMMECVDGDYQTFKAKDGAYVREYFFNTPELKAMVADLSDMDIWQLNRGGHDPMKIYAAFNAAVNHKGQPTVILAKTIKGYSMGESGEAQNTSHQQKKMSGDSLKRFRERYELPIDEEDLEKLPYLKFAEDSKEMVYMRKRREELGGFLPNRRAKSTSLEIPGLDTFKSLLESTGEGREISTTMAFVRMLNILVKDKNIGNRIVPIVPDESRTFGMEGMFRQLGIWSQVGQLYTPQDADQLMFYKESKHGQVLQEGINEAGGICDWIAAGTSYSTHNVPLIPFFIFYSMFGFQRIGDLIWAAADQRTRGFLLGGTAGRTTLNGEGLQHEDGHSHIFASTVPNCVSYDPTYAYEVIVIIQDGMRRMYAEQEDIFYYLTVMNENYEHPAMPQGIEQDILKGMYLFKAGGKTKAPRVQLLGSGTIFREVVAAAELLKADWKVEADLWSCPSFTELARDGQSCDRWNRLHPTETPRKPHVKQCLENAKGPIVAATDYIRLFAEQIRPYISASYTVLGTDGFGRSDSREALRRFFEVNRYHIVVTALKSLADAGEIELTTVKNAITQYGINPDSPAPWRL
ncbi:pyruvate dehydrogenase (acetyl-transferring), homodimeric type [Methylicorpusculum sp.]|uniref:pyruvate dehydrogenase (acetyl-transferring), homodimeric type n=1 Tax=Methylicorpusculum sp. TaxID=2713644 RepID=UPI00271D9CC1|nr:pyruvate dehydrogenase (acetyl-transferring), homodimeric type [Methylicorpusculum sp.]MDO9239309.1 pyruvate dehydrogenase (acetyl-transferring), homodimeric type [Methylicorpusculum sp.]MDP2180104.1 pyruvate dehydrogenase (acetyl-transferring), homodimeric type [Methylicorpusculum sp.]MDP3530657.1 pyruvate dehydrogenase (acetyl-transferring), homodimeric type [Methylicorpusculum sp.]MDZ4149769.1 pyruvate dehydrogenase (acetyl-transferring), homodimeric type [Methylicorpusculum sp.]